MFLCTWSAPKSSSSNTHLSNTFPITPVTTHSRSTRLPSSASHPPASWSCVATCSTYHTNCLENPPSAHTSPVPPPSDPRSPYPKYRPATSSARAYRCVYTMANHSSPSSPSPSSSPCPSPSGHRTSNRILVGRHQPPSPPVFVHSSPNPRFTRGPPPVRAPASASASAGRNGLSSMPSRAARRRCSASLGAAPYALPGGIQGSLLLLLPLLCGFLRLGRDRERPSLDGRRRRVKLGL